VITTRFGMINEVHNTQSCRLSFEVMYFMTLSILRGAPDVPDYATAPFIVSMKTAPTLVNIGEQIT
jgi:hypothetical protein